MIVPLVAGPGLVSVSGSGADAAGGAVVAAGAFLGEKAEQVAAVVKMIQNVLIGLVAFVVSKAGSGVGKGAGYAFVGGVAIFSGTLYAMALGGPRWLGAVTPIGGLTLIVGWVLLAIAGWKTLE